MILKIRKFHWKAPVLESLFNKVTGLQAWNFLIKRLQHKRFPIKFATFSRTPILTNICLESRATSFNFRTMMELFAEIVRDHCGCETLVFLKILRKYKMNDPLAKTVNSYSILNTPLPSVILKVTLSNQKLNLLWAL